MGVIVFQKSNAINQITLDSQSIAIGSDLSGEFVQKTDFNPAAGFVHTSIYAIDSASFDWRIDNIPTGSGGTIDTSSLLTTESFNNFTQSYYIDSESFDNRINNVTGSGATINAADLNIIFMSGSIASGSDYFNYDHVLNSFKHGFEVTASGEFSRAFGNYANASGYMSIAEGDNEIGRAHV